MTRQRGTAGLYLRRTVFTSFQLIAGVGKCIFPSTLPLVVPYGTKPFFKFDGNSPKETIDRPHSKDYTVSQECIKQQNYAQSDWEVWVLSALQILQ